MYYLQANPIKWEYRIKLCILFEKAVYWQCQLYAIAVLKIIYLYMYGRIKEKGKNQLNKVIKGQKTTRANTFRGTEMVNKWYYSFQHLGF